MMTSGFSAEWEQQFAEGRHHSLWPWSDLVGLATRFLSGAGRLRVLELGCGVGANIGFFSALGADYFGIEGSATAVAATRRRFPGLAENIVHGDFTNEIPFEGMFDAIVDRSALTHNSTADIVRVVSVAWERLRPGAPYIGVDWFSKNHPCAGEGTAVDNYTRTDFEDGPFAGVGRVHFSDEAHLREVFGAFALKVLDEKILTRSLPSRAIINATWNFVAMKA